MDPVIAKNVGRNRDIGVCQTYFSWHLLHMQALRRCDPRPDHMVLSDTCKW